MWGARARSTSAIYPTKKYCCCTFEEPANDAEHAAPEQFHSRNQDYVMKYKADPHN